MAHYERTARIYPNKDYGFEMETVDSYMMAENMDEVGENLEELLWPIIFPLLNNKVPFTITVQNIDED